MAQETLSNPEAFLPTSFVAKDFVDVAVEEAKPSGSECFVVEKPWEKPDENMKNPEVSQERNPGNEKNRRIFHDFMIG